MIFDSFDISAGLNPGFGHTKRSGSLSDESSILSYTIVEPFEVYFKIRSTTYMYTYKPMKQISQVCMATCLYGKTEKQDQ